MFYSISLINFIFCVLTVFWLIKISHSANWLAANQKTTGRKRPIVFFVLIPLLREENRIIPTVEYFQGIIGESDNIKLVLITTEKEFVLIGRDKEIDTIKVVADLKNKYGNILSYHYPQTDGKMSHQLNYAIKEINKSNPDKQEIIFAVYNADSRPAKETFDWVNDNCQSGQGQIFQQYGDYLKNFDGLTGPGRNILRAAALWQNRWSLGFELPHALAQFRYINRRDSYFYPLNYCIGHGLFFTPDIFVELGGFNEAMHNEDAIWGLEASFNRQLIKPIPFFDEADVPDSLGGLYKQKSSWYFGPAQAFAYYRYIKRHKHLTATDSKLKLGALSVKLFLHAVYWVVGPTLVFISLLVPLLFMDFKWFLADYAVALLFLALPNYFAYRIISRQKNIQSKKIIGGLLVGSIPGYLLHGLSAYRAIMLILAANFFNLDIKKEKTAMSK